jgi:hypothetical protein
MTRRPVDPPATDGALQAVDSHRRSAATPQRPLTSHERSAGVDPNVQQLLDWLVDEELRRWQRETQ